MKKIIVTLIITIFLITFVLFSLPIVAESTLPITGRIITAIIAITILVFIIRVLVERLLEIKEEDKDDLSKY